MCLFVCNLCWFCVYALALAVCTCVRWGFHVSEFVPVVRLLHNLTCCRLAVLIIAVAVLVLLC